MTLCKCWVKEEVLFLFGTKLLIYQTGCSCWTDLMSWTKQQLFLHPHPHPKEWMSLGAEARRSEKRLLAQIPPCLWLLRESVCALWTGLAVAETHWGPSSWLDSSGLLSEIRNHSSQRPASKEWVIPSAGLSGPPISESPCQSRSWALWLGLESEARTTLQNPYHPVEK